MLDEPMVTEAEWRAISAVINSRMAPSVTLPELEYISREAAVAAAKVRQQREAKLVEALQNVRDTSSDIWVVDLATDTLKELSNE